MVLLRRGTTYWMAMPWYVDRDSGILCQFFLLECGISEIGHPHSRAEGRISGENLIFCDTQRLSRFHFSDKCFRWDVGQRIRCHGASTVIMDPLPVHSVGFWHIRGGSAS